jgi:hypothetical protein
VCAATAATLLTQPTDVVRTRMQLGLPGVAKGDALSTLGHVLRSSGPNALLTGEVWTDCLLAAVGPKSCSVGSREKAAGVGASLSCRWLCGFMRPPQAQLDVFAADAAAGCCLPAQVLPLGC